MTYKTKMVDTTELCLGDIVHEHGGRFELVSALIDEAEAAEHAAYFRQYPYAGESAEQIETRAKRHESLRSFATRYLGPMDERWPCGVPEHCRDCAENPTGWIIQGNDSARWAVEVCEVDDMPHAEDAPGFVEFPRGEFPA